MAIIDSGLGWKCDSDYYVSAADTVLIDETAATVTKTNTGGCIAVSYWTIYNNYGLALVSTEPNCVAATLTGDVNSYPGSAVLDGVTWYINGLDSPTYHNSRTYVDDYPLSPVQAGIGTTSQEIAGIIQAANVEFDKSIPSTDYVKAFVEGVEAETATRVNALNTSKQPKTMSSAVTVGGVSQSTVEGAIGAMATKISKIDFDINRNLGTEITAAQKLAIATGTFEDLPIGAYWTLNNTVYRIAHHDYYLGTGDTACTSHHIVVVPDNNMYSAKMNDTDTTAGGYAGSKMRTENLATALSTFETDFGVSHILSHRILITNAVNNGQASGWIWANSKVDLMSENMLYGHAVWGQAGYETGVENAQLVLFSLYPEFIQKQRSSFWLRYVGSNSNFGVENDGGHTSPWLASNTYGVRPYACIYFDDVLT